MFLAQDPTLADFGHDNWLLVIIKVITSLQTMRRPSELEEAEATEIELLTEIRDALVSRPEA